MKIIFETERLTARNLIYADLEEFHKMQSNINVMKYTKGVAMTFEENETELKKLIDFYKKPNNGFWVYAVERKKDNVFLGTVALIENDLGEYEIGFRFLEKYWGYGYGTEIVKGLIEYSKKKGFKQLTAFVVHKNTASTKIIEKYGFEFVKDLVSDDLKLPERKYMLEL